MTHLITWQEAARRAGQHYGAAGGKKSSENMTGEQRIERAKKAVAARKWRPVKVQKSDAMGKKKAGKIKKSKKTK